MALQTYRQMLSRLRDNLPFLRNCFWVKKNGSAYVNLMLYTISFLLKITFMAEPQRAIKFENILMAKTTPPCTQPYAI